MKHFQPTPWLTLVLLAGCASTPDPINQRVLELAAEINPVTPGQPAASGVDATPPAPELNPGPPAAGLNREAPTQLVSLAQAEPPPKEGERRRTRLTIPPELPGADQAALERLPDDPAKRLARIKELFPELPPLPPFTAPAPGPHGQPLTLAELQHLADQYSPALKVAEAAVIAAKGAVWQAGMYPNPSIFFETDTAQTFQAGYQGMGVDQVIKTGNKLKLQQAAASMDLINAELAVKKARADLAAQVRAGYFGVLVARESIRINEALYRFAKEIYRVQADLLNAIPSPAAVYEPMALRTLVLQAEIAVITSRNQYITSWKQLAAALGLPDMCPAEVAGGVNLPIPCYDYHAVLEHIVKHHTDVLTAEFNVQKARYSLALARITPLPDVDFHFLIQKDYTTPPFQIVCSLAATVPEPIWDQNKGNILQAQGNLAQAVAQVEQTRQGLVPGLADAFNRYQTNRRIVELSQVQIRDQVRYFKHAYDRRNAVPGEVAFGDLVNAQQTLATYLANYLAALGAQWTAVVDIAHLLQTDDLFQACEHMHPLSPLELLPAPKPAAAPPGKPEGLPPPQASSAPAPPSSPPVPPTQPAVPAAPVPGTTPTADRRTTAGGQQ
jgi:cobalt-zinc-cadmium efflux system outer membrane protein